MSLFSWIDHSEADRRKMLEAIDMFRERGTRDELGLSVIRDAFADRLFPGTGSLQRRARYFFFVPWMFEAFEKEGVRSSEMARRAKQFEVRLIDALKAQGDHKGVIGIEKREKLQRFPSSIYWHGLRRLGMRVFPGSPDDYYHSLDEWHSKRRRTLRNDDGEAVDAATLNWRPGMPSAPPGFPESADFRMTTAEADYLKERIQAEARLSLLAFLADRSNTRTDVSYVWEHPLSSDFSAELKRVVGHARNFAEALHGASILYNLMLARMEPVRAELVEELSAIFEQWHLEMKARHRELREWNRPEVWATVSRAGGAPSHQTRAFVDEWLNHLLTSLASDGQIDSDHAHEVISTRERRLKGALARLHNPRARELWNGSSGLGRLEYRWANAQILINDLLEAS
jgi:hypothetical protein